MRVVVWGLVFVTVACGASSLFSEAWGQRREARPEVATGTGQLIAVASDNGGGPQQVVLIDPQARVMGVYHVDRTTGELSLKSVRNVHWDLMMDEFNGSNPSPREIRSLLPR